GGVLTDLQRSDVGHDRPAIGYVYLCRVAGHGAEAVTDDAEQIVDWRLAQAIDMERRRVTESALHDHAIAVAHIAVAGDAEDLEALLAALDDGAVEWTARQPGLVAQVTARHGAGRQGAARTAVGELRTRLKRAQP